MSSTNIGIVLKTTMGRLLRDREECVRAFPSALMPSWEETGNFAMITV